MISVVEWLEKKKVKKSEEKQRKMHTIRSQEWSGPPLQPVGGGSIMLGVQVRCVGTPSPFGMPKSEVQT